MPQKQKQQLEMKNKTQIFSNIFQLVNIQQKLTFNWQ